jgi:hypothetical protein
VNAQAMPVKMNNKITPGPPLKIAPPKLLKLPAPNMAAMPKKVRSRALKTLFNAGPSWVESVSCENDSIGLRLNKEDDMLIGLVIKTHGSSNIVQVGAIESLHLQ